MRKTPQEEVPIRQIRQCVFVEWFRFHQCTITSCKNHTEITDSKCMAIDRVQPAGIKVITDAELHMYKFPNAGISTRLVAMKRKNAIDRVKSVLILKDYIQHLYEKYQHTVQKPIATRHTERTEILFPLRIKRLGFQRWMWPHLTNKKEYKEFTSTRKGECTLFELHDLLHMTDMKFNALVKSINQGV